MLKRKLIDLASARTAALAAAEAALTAGNQAEYDSRMIEVTNMNAEISRIQNLIAEQDRNLDIGAPSASEAREGRQPSKAPERPGVGSHSYT